MFRYDIFSRLLIQAKIYLCLHAFVQRTFWVKLPKWFLGFLLFTFQNQSGCTMELTAALGEWRSTMMVSGGKCAITNGARK